MNKRIKRKVMKGKFWHYNGSMLWQYHAYQADQRTREVMLCYDETGNECYFRNWRSAKRYLRTMTPYKLEWPPEDVEIPDEVIMHNGVLTHIDDIPF